MKRIFNAYNMILILVVALIGVLTFKATNVKATGTVTWSGPSSVTIREIVHDVANAPDYSREYWVEETDTGSTPITPTMAFTGNETITNNTVTETVVANFSNLSYSKAGDYMYNIYPADMIDKFPAVSEDLSYRATVSIRNIVDANNVPTGNFTASLILQECTYNEQTDDFDCTKVSPVSGVYYANFDYQTDPDWFGHIEISKTVKGIGADTNEYFPMTINLGYNEDSYSLIDPSNYVYPITGIDAQVTYGGQTITQPTTITNGTPVTIYIKHGQTAIIGQVTKTGGGTFDAIPSGRTGGSGGGGLIKHDSSKEPKVIKIANTIYGSHYSVEEDPKDYTPSFAITPSSLYTSGYATADTVVAPGTNEVSFVNEKTMTPVTGIILTLIPYIILIGIGIGGTLLFMSLKKKKTNKV